MKGETNAIPDMVKTYTTVTAELLASIPNNAVWAISGEHIEGTSDDRHVFLMGCGPILKATTATEYTVIAGGFHYFNPSNNYSPNMCYINSDDKLYLSFFSKSVNYNQVWYGSATFDLSDLTLYLIGGGEPELLTCTVSMMEAVA